MEIYGLIARALRRVSQARGRAALRPEGAFAAAGPRQKHLTARATQR